MEEGVGAGGGRDAALATSTPSSATGQGARGAVSPSPPRAGEGRGEGASAGESTAVIFTFWVCLFASLILIAGVVLSGPYVAWRAVQDRLASIQRVNGHIAADNERLKAETEAVRSDPFYAERVVRVHLGWQRDGDRVIALRPAGAGANMSDEPVVTGPRTWMERCAFTIARDAKKRAVTLLAAGVLLVIAFACFGGSRAGGARKS